MEEMLHPERVPAEARARAREAAKDPLDPGNLFNISWKDAGGRVRYVVLDPALTGVDATIIVLLGAGFPSGSHKVGAAYSVAMERQLAGDISPGEVTLIWPSTGNYGIGGAWVGPRLGYSSVVILPEAVSRERFERITSYGARYIKTPGCESSVKEIFDACRRLQETDPSHHVLNQFDAMANYRFHYYVTGNSVLEAARDEGDGRVAAFVSGMGSAGTIAAGDRLKQAFPACRVVGLEPVQCPTLFENGFGDHDIQGIGDKHVIWIHNVMNMDLLVCVDDMACKKGLRLLTDPAGRDYLDREAGVDGGLLERLSPCLGISGVANILGAIKTAKFYGFGAGDNIVTVATDGFDRYGSVMEKLSAACGPLDARGAAACLEAVFHGVRLDWVQEGDRLNRARWHNLKYFTWVEQRGKSVETLNAMRSQEWWMAEQAKVAEFDRNLAAARGF